jgi:hypothetical protein
VLWYKAWLETRWRFLVGLAVMACSAAATVLFYPQVRALVPLAPTDAAGELGRRVREAAELARTFRGYVWSHGFAEDLSQMGTLFAALLGTAGMLGPSGAPLFTLSLPVTRHRLLAVRCAVGLGELAVITFVPALLVPLLSPSVGAGYRPAEALAHGACLFVGTSVVFSLAVLLSAMSDGPWAPLLGTLAVAAALGVADRLLQTPSWSLYGLVSGETLFRTGRLPWAGLLAGAAASALLLLASAVRLDRRDF